MSNRYFGRGSCNGSFGELLQGTLGAHNEDFLVTLPISCSSRAIFTFEPDLPTLRVSPRHKWKSRQLAVSILNRYGFPERGRLLLLSELPEGKGMASSTADLVATSRAIESCFAIHIPLMVLERLISSIEPSDGVMHPGIVAFFHRRVQLLRLLGTLPRLCIVAIDEGGRLDTIQFNKEHREFTSEEQGEYRDLLKRLSTAIETRNLGAVGEIATQSAIMNQRHNPKRTLNAFLEVRREVGALGIVVAHSGTCLGVLLWPGDPQCRMQLQQVRRDARALGMDVSIYSSLP